MSLLQLTRDVCTKTNSASHQIVVKILFHVFFSFFFSLYVSLAWTSRENVLLIYTQHNWWLCNVSVSNKFFNSLFLCSWEKMTSVKEVVGWDMQKPLHKFLTWKQKLGLMVNSTTQQSEEEKKQHTIETQTRHIVISHNFTLPHPTPHPPLHPPYQHTRNETSVSLWNSYTVFAAFIQVKTNRTILPFSKQTFPIFPFHINNDLHTFQQN